MGGVTLLVGVDRLAGLGWLDKVVLLNGDVAVPQRVSLGDGGDWIKGARFKSIVEMPKSWLGRDGMVADRMGLTCVGVG